MFYSIVVTGATVISAASGQSCAVMIDDYTIWRDAERSYCIMLDILDKQALESSGNTLDYT